MHDVAGEEMPRETPSDGTEKPWRPVEHPASAPGEFRKVRIQTRNYSYSFPEWMMSNRFDHGGEPNEAKLIHEGLGIDANP